MNISLRRVFTVFLDPEGLLFYNSTSDFEGGDNVKYKVFYNKEGLKAIKVDVYSAEVTFASVRTLYFGCSIMLLSDNTSPPSA